ncbi:hypothetical protein CDIK_3726, partial [Cucumispora dikerogammari]
YIYKICKLKAPNHKLEKSQETNQQEYRMRCFNLYLQLEKNEARVKTTVFFKKELKYIISDRRIKIFLTNLKNTENNTEFSVIIHIPFYIYTLNGTSFFLVAELCIIYTNLYINIKSIFLNFFKKTNRKHYTN